MAVKMQAVLFYDWTHSMGFVAVIKWRRVLFCFQKFFRAVLVGAVVVGAQFFYGADGYEFGASAYGYTPYGNTEFLTGASL